MTIKEYRKHPNVANSDLRRNGAKHKLIFTIKNNEEAMQDNFDFGSLTHLLAQERLTGEMDNEGLPEKYFDKNHKDYELANKMTDSIWSNRFFKLLVSNNPTTVEEPYIKDNVVFKNSMNGMLETINGKCLADFDTIESPFGHVISDLKTTKAKTNDEFKKSIVTFGYHAAADWYMDCSGANVFILFGISKYNKEVLTYVFNGKNDPLLKKGRELKNKLCTYWNLYC